MQDIWEYFLVGDWVKITVTVRVRIKVRAISFQCEAPRNIFRGMTKVN